MILDFQELKGLTSLEEVNCVPKKQFSLHEDQLLNLFNNYILSKIEIASITFRDDIESIDGKIEFGNVDSPSAGV